jgi:hypothetical protein
MGSEEVLRCEPIYSFNVSSIFIFINVFILRLSVH